MKICDYSCGQKAEHQFKNGKWCCSETFYECVGYRRKLSEAKKGKTQSKEHRRKNSEAQKGKRKSKEHREKLSEALKGRSYEELHGKEKAEEIKKKSSESHKNPSKETREKMSEALKNPSKEKRKKISKATKKQWQDPNSKINSKETKRKQRLAAIKRIEKNSGQVSPNYNSEACKLIKEYGIKNGYDFQHAENGGEFYIKDLGYWVDGYDKNKNIVIEIDESHHFDPDGNLNIKDIERQQEIIDSLGCNFIRLKI